MPGHGRTKMSSETGNTEVQREQLVHQREDPRRREESPWMTGRPTQKSYLDPGEFEGGPRPGAAELAGPP